MKFECGPFSSVLRAVCVAGEVFYATQGKSVTLTCGVGPSYKILEWRHGNNRIIQIDAKTGRNLKGSKKHI